MNPRPRNPKPTTEDDSNLATLIPDALNARKRTDTGRERIRQSLAEVGPGRSVLIGKGRKILAGHGVVEQAKALGLKLKIVQGDANTLIAVERTDLTPEQEIRAGLWDNRAADDAGYDVAMIAKLAKSGHTAGIFTDADLKSLKLAARKVGGKRKHPDDIPPVLDTVIVKPGDLFGFWPFYLCDCGAKIDDLPELQRQKGAGNYPVCHACGRTMSDANRRYRHKLLCGDATKREDVDRLMAGELADVLVTDPPYGVLYGQSGGGKANAIRGDLSQAEIPVSFAVALEHGLNADARIYLCGGTTNLLTYWKLFDHYLRIMPRLIVWGKESFLLRHNNYHSQFELIYFGWKGKGGGSSNWFGDRKQSDLWMISRDPNYVHPTQKPVALFAKAIGNSCPPDGLIFEPFAGSGTALIAAEQEGRRCYALELDPRFVQVIIERWEAFTGQKAVLTPGPK